MLLDRLWAYYAAEVPYARTFVQLTGGQVRTDHVAFRTLARPGGGIEPIAQLFERQGWYRAGTYRVADAALPTQRVTAIHLSHPDGRPRIFVSQLHLDALSSRAREILLALPPDPPLGSADDEVVLAHWFGPRGPVVEADLLALENESPYAAWLLAFGRKVSHFSAQVHDVESWQALLRVAGVPMSDTIQGEPGTVLRQTTSLSAPLAVPLQGGGEREWPYTRLGISQRAPGFDGFLTPRR